MALADHPTYPNPTIQEALCEIQFRLQEGVMWNPSWYGDFYRQVEHHFPVILPISTPQIRLEISQPAIPTPVLLVPQVMRYQNVTGNLLLQLSENRIVVNVLPDYPGWLHVTEHVQYAWEKVCDVVKPTAATRIGLRYINRIERREPDETLGTWLMANDYIPTAVLTSKPGFLSRIETQLSLEDRISVTVSDRDISPQDTGAFLLDIDHATVHDIPTDIDLLLQEATRLHGNIWEVFHSAKGERLEQLLQGEIL
jgi:uncharacterized protein (TIGR04255 family)